MKNIFIFFLLFLSLSTLGNAKNIKPKANLSSEEVILIQLNALKNNDTNDSGIEQTWLFAHPKNKLATGPYAKFKKMLYDPHYIILQISINDQMMMSGIHHFYPSWCNTKIF